jgi:hypothetical protein
LFASVALGACANVRSFAQSPATAAPIAAEPAQRLIVLTDIEADPDDTQSLVRLLLYANEIDIEGLIATTSTWKRTSVAPDSIRNVLNAYRQIYPNLRLHDANYPTPDALGALVSEGRPESGMLGVGPDDDSPGAQMIIRALERDDARPLWISVWGGANTLAQALYELRETRAPEELERLVAKLRVYTISDQDDSGPWMREQFPGLFYVVSPGGDYAAATWTGINSVVGGIDNSTISNPWLAEHIQQDHGPLGAAYPDVAWGVEGDTPAFLSLIPNGLNNAEHPNWGGWGGRYELYTPDPPTRSLGDIVNGIPISAETRPIWTNAYDAYAPPLLPEYGRSIRVNPEPTRDFKSTLWRWRDDFQNDFAARMDWTINSVEDANHPPAVRLTHPNRLTLRSGHGAYLSAAPSTDPDGDSLSYLWFFYREAGSYRGDVDLGAENASGVWVTAPVVTQTESMHFIVRVTDKGEPPLTRYERIIVTVEP